MPITVSERRVKVSEKRRRRVKRGRKGPTGLGGLGSGTGRGLTGPSPGKDFGDQMEDRRLPRDYQRQGMTDEDLRKRLKQRPISRLTGGQAKGRGMGLQDEKMKPGKVMKANSGDMANKKNFRGFSKVFKGPQDKGRVATISGTKPTLRANSKAAKAARFALKAARATTIGKIALGVAAAGLTAKEYLKRKMKKNEKKPQKKMGGGMMMRPNPMGYKKGVLVKVKLGRNKPTKLY